MPSNYDSALRRSDRHHIVHDGRWVCRASYVERMVTQENSRSRTVERRRVTSPPTTTAIASATGFARRSLVNTVENYFVRLLRRHRRRALVVGL